MSDGIQMNQAQSILSKCTFGHRVAEDEADALSEYFVETENWLKVFNGEVDVVYGPKGAGKSALYSLLVFKTDELFDKGVLLVAGENPRGAPAFQNLSIDPPESEVVFVGLWKLYILTIINNTLAEYGISNEHTKRLNSYLADEGLAEKNRDLSAYVQSAFDYVRSFFRREVEAIEGGFSFDTVTQLPNGLNGKITFREPGQKQREEGFVSVGSLFDDANTALKHAGISIWVLLDRLDVAFAESSDLEKNALRALFRTYLDLLGFDAIRIKIFLRTDIWNRIIEEGFREASHITKHVTIRWNETSALNLISRRFLRNQSIQDTYAVAPSDVLADSEEQERLFYRIFPDQVDVGPNKLRSFNWILSRTSDATSLYSPREIIHFLNSIRIEQLKRYENGVHSPEDGRLFERSTFKEALPDVSNVRLQQTLFAEHPDLKDWVESLTGEKTEQSVETLAKVWNVKPIEAEQIAERLVQVGFFERRGPRAEPRYWVPFLYRDALNLSQGSATQ
ncbi:MAG: hypothetical protein AAFY80_15445 [Pseudomonadota bacterium]